MGNFTTTNVGFNGDIPDWQFTSGIIAPKRTDKRIESLTVTVAGDLLVNKSFVDDVTLIMEPAQTYTYDDNGNLLTASNTEGNTSSTRDSSERLTAYTAMNGVSYQLTYNGSSRNPKTITSDGVTTTYGYNNAGSVISTKVENSSNDSYLESTASYNSARNFQTSVTDVNGSTVSYTYNNAKGLLTKTTDPTGIETHYNYYENSNRLKSTHITDSNYLYRLYSRGQIKQVTRKTKFNGTTTRQAYNFQLDDWGNTTAIRVWQPGEDETTSISTYFTLASYEYNVNGSLSKMIYSNGDYVMYTYDLLDRLVKEVYYNSNNAAQAEYRYVYNANGQLAKQYALSGTTVKETYSFEYDSLGRLIRSREEGSAGLVQRTEHLYDSAGRIKRQNWSIGSRGYYETYTYDSGDGSLATMRAGNGSKLEYTYDALKRLTKATVTVKNQETQEETELFSRRYSYRGVSGEENRTTKRLYTMIYRDASENMMSGNRYTYDANGNITKIEEFYKTVGTTNYYRKIATYTYDNLNQLTQEKRYTYNDNTDTVASTATINYTIDTAGNIRSVSGGGHTVSYEYNSAYWADRLSKVTVDNVSKTISYVKEEGGYGNPLNWYNGTEYTDLTWTQGRRLSSITKHLSSSTRTYSYAYDMSGIRTRKTVPITVNGVLRQKRYDYVTQNGKVVRELARYTDGAGEFIHCLDFFYDENGNPYAVRKYNTPALTLSNSTMCYYILNAQGDVLKLIDESGNTCAKYTYDAWGNILSSSGTLANTNPLRYRGYYFDSETGFYYLQSRYYDPALGRFINADCRTSSNHSFIGYNMFAYCGNNPMMNIDPYGESWWEWIAAAVVVVALVTASVITCGGVAAAAGTAAAIASGTCTAVSTTATVITGAAVGSGTALVTTAIIASDEAESIDEFADYGEEALRNTLIGGVIGGLEGFSNASSKCFIAGTLVYSDDGAIPIEQIKTGDYVWAWDEDSGDVALKQVVETYINETDELTHIFVCGEEIICTPGHKFYAPKKGWTSACRLRTGDILVLLNGEYVVVEKVQHELLEAPVKVYNFQVADYHSYFISAEKILVHNDCPSPNGRKGSEAHQKTINDTKRALEEQGYTVKPEQYVKTPGGFKERRFLDLYASKGDNSFGVQVGRMNRNGLPVARELKAIYDVLNAGIKAVIFIEY